MPWNSFTVANDALTVVVNQQNTWARCLSVAELKKIWEPGSKVNNWKDVRAGFPDVPLKLFGPGTDSGTFEYFTEAINGRARASRTDYQASENDNVLVQGVSGEQGGMGYFGYSYYTENRSRLNAIQVRNPQTDACITPGDRERAQQDLQAALETALHLREGDLVQAEEHPGFHRLHLRQRGEDRDPRTVRPAHEGAVEAGEERLPLRRSRRQGKAKASLRASACQEGRPTGRPSLICI